MSDVPLGQGWWQASDDKWYPPETIPVSQGAAPDVQAATASASTYSYSSPQTDVPGVAGQPTFAALPTEAAPASGSQKTEPTAIWAMILAVVLPPIGFVLGWVARFRIKQNNRRGGGIALTARIVGAGLTALAIVLVVSAGSPPDLHNMNNLSSAVLNWENNQIQTSSASYWQQLRGQGVSVTSVTCVSTGGSKATCTVNGSNGGSDNLNVTITPDGTDWSDTGN